MDHLLMKGTMKLYQATGKIGDEGLYFLIDHEQNPIETVEALLKEAGLSVGEFRMMGEGGKIGGLVEAINK